MAYAADLVQLLQQFEMPELLVELLGTLGTLPSYHPLVVVGAARVGV